MGSPPLLEGPIPIYSNYPIQAYYYQPSQYFISAIALGQITTVTTSMNHDYVVGQLCRLIIPNGYGSRLLNEMTGYVISIPMPNQVTLDINSSMSDPFVLANLPTQPQILAVGDGSSGSINSNGRVTSTFIPGSFINVSP